MKQSDICIIIPTYNNAKFLPQVLDAVLPYNFSVIVVNDGSTDDTNKILSHYQPDITVLPYSPNRGKGYALSKGFDVAESIGFKYAITMDSDSQHLPENLPLFVEVISKNPNALIVGSRNLHQENMPAKNSFANKFSNFWFVVQTGNKLPDTQTGFRLYPLNQMKGMRPITSRYEAELELLVRSAWRNIKLIPIPIQVYYPEEGVRISHFRPAKDFFRISLLNALFCLLAIVYGYPAKFFYLLSHLSLKHE
ncbi:MAG: glycosyltransferase family 2 protein [Bacteroidales bacterium]|jgi:glycosyltransferase involved in cell wall biosynthesis|nr:glycosyltransferase family 2 protein [Bacteroidales bacterium]